MGFSESKLEFIRSSMKDIELLHIEDIVSVASQSMPWVPPGTTECFMVEDIHIRVMKNPSIEVNDDGEEVYKCKGAVDGIYQ